MDTFDWNLQKLTPAGALGGRAIQAPTACLQRASSATARRLRQTTDGARALLVGADGSSLAIGRSRPAPTTGRFAHTRPTARCALVRRSSGPRPLARSPPPRSPPAAPPHRRHHLRQRDQQPAADRQRQRQHHLAGHTARVEHCCVHRQRRLRERAPSPPARGTITFAGAGTSTLTYRRRHSVLGRDGVDGVEGDRPRPCQPDQRDRSAHGQRGAPARPRWAIQSDLAGSARPRSTRRAPERAVRDDPGFVCGVQPDECHELAARAPA